jgi:hypothetical protein
MDWTFDAMEYSFVSVPFIKSKKRRDLRKFKRRKRTIHAVMCDVLIRLLMITPGIGEYIWTFLDVDSTFAGVIVDPPSWYFGPKEVAVPDRILLENKRTMTERVLDNFCKKRVSFRLSDSWRMLEIKDVWELAHGHANILMIDLFVHRIVAKSWLKALNIMMFLGRFEGMVPVYKKYAYWLDVHYFDFPPTHWVNQHSKFDFLDRLTARQTRSDNKKKLHRCDTDHLVGN